MALFEFFQTLSNLAIHNSFRNLWLFAERPARQQASPPLSSIYHERLRYTLNVRSTPFKFGFQ